MGAEEGLNAFTIPSGPQNQTQPFVEELRKHNISHLASFYSFDEYSGPFSAIASEFAPLKKLYPEVTTLTTAHIGQQYGGLVKAPLPFTAAALRSLSIDAVTPQTNYLPPKSNITELKAGGRQVWTYISVQP